MPARFSLPPLPGDFTLVAVCINTLTGNAVVLAQGIAHDELATWRTTVQSCEYFWGHYFPLGERGDNGLRAGSEEARADFRERSAAL